MVFQITGIVTIQWSFFSGADQRKHPSSASLALRWQVDSPHKTPPTIWWRHHASNKTLAYPIISERKLGWGGGGGIQYKVVVLPVEEFPLWEKTVLSMELPLRVRLYSSYWISPLTLEHSQPCGNWAPKAVFIIWPDLAIPKLQQLHRWNLGISVGSNLTPHFVMDVITYPCCD